MGTQPVGTNRTFWIASASRASHVTCSTCRRTTEERSFSPKAPNVTTSATLGRSLSKRLATPPRGTISQRSTSAGSSATTPSMSSQVSTRPVLGVLLPTKPITDTAISRRTLRSGRRARAGGAWRRGTAGRRPGIWTGVSGRMTVLAFQISPCSSVGSRLRRGARCKACRSDGSVSNRLLRVVDPTGEVPLAIRGCPTCGGVSQTVSERRMKEVPRTRVKAQVCVSRSRVCQKSCR